MKGCLSLDAALLRTDSPTEEARSFFIRWFSTLLHNGIIWRGSKRPWPIPITQNLGTGTPQVISACSRV